MLKGSEVTYDSTGDCVSILSGSVPVKTCSEYRVSAADLLMVIQCKGTRSVLRQKCLSDGRIASETSLLPAPF